MHTWTTSDDGTVVVNGETWRIGSEEALFSARLAPLAPIFAAASAKHGIAASWLAGQAWQETRLNPRTIGHDPGGSTGVGLFQLTSGRFKKGHTLAELQTPELNTDLAAEFLAELAAGGNDLPAVASMFNAGAEGKPGALTPHRSALCLKVTIVDGKPVGKRVPGNLWGFAEACGHIDGVIRGNNSAIALASGTPKPNSGGALAAGAVCLGLLLAHAKGWA